MKKTHRKKSPARQILLKILIDNSQIGISKDNKNKTYLDIDYYNVHKMMCGNITLSARERNYIKQIIRKAEIERYK